MSETFRGELPSKKEIEQIQKEVGPMVERRKKEIEEAKNEKKRQREFREAYKPWDEKTVARIRASKRRTPVERGH